jgi:hypothetical protein
LCDPFQTVHETEQKVKILEQKPMTIENPYGLIAPITDAQAAICFMHLAERVEEIHFWGYLAEWAKVDADDLDWHQLGVSKDGTHYLETAGQQVAFAEWLRQRLCSKVFVDFAPLWFAPYSQKIYLSQESTNSWRGPRTSNIELGPRQARQLRDRLDHVLTTEVAPQLQTVR